MWFIDVEVEQETSAPPPKKNPGSAPEGNPKNLINYWVENAISRNKLHYPIHVTDSRLQGMETF